MLSDKECTFISQFLEDFPSADLFALALLVSKHNLQPNSRKDALDIICQHSERIEFVLEKKKISKKYLCQYLHKNKVSIIQSWDKPALIRKVLEFWNVSSSDNLTSQEDQNTCSDSLQTNLPSNYYDQLTTKFSEWFYSIINDQNLSNLRPEHFFIDAQIKLALHDEEAVDVIEANSSTDIAQVLQEVQSKYRLKFLPNLTPEGLRYQTDIHGQIMLMVSGTLHSISGSQVVGVFEQIFLLIRDISDNENWKIKNSQIILRTLNNAIKYSKNSQNIVPVYS